MEKATLLSRLNKLIPGLILEKGKFGRSEKPVLWIESASVLGIADTLKSDPELQLDWLENLSAMQMDDILVVSWFLRSSANPSLELVLRATVVPASPTALAEIPSTRAIWAMAEPFEREVLELFGILFVTSADAEEKHYRLPKGWQGYPLRRSYRFPEEVDGIRHAQRQPTVALIDDDEIENSRRAKILASLKAREASLGGLLTDLRAYARTSVTGKSGPTTGRFPAPC